MSAAKDELHWHNNPLPALLRLAWPIAVSMVSHGLMTLVDTIFVGCLGPSALAGVGLAGTCTFVLLCFPYGLLRATKVLVSQSVGAGRRDEVGAYLGAALLFAVGLGALLLGVGALLATHMAELTATTAAGVEAESYFSVRMLGTPVVMVFVALRETRYGLGDSRSAMVATVAGNSVNVVLDYLFIFVLGAGVAGAAWASNVAVVVEVTGLLLAQRSDGFGVGRCRWGHVRATWRLGLPTGAQFGLEVGSFALLAVMISRLSEAQMAAHQIALQVIHLSFLPGFALGDAASILVGQAVGARREELVRPVARLALAGAVAYMGVCALVLVAGGETLARGFTDDAEVVTVAGRLFAVAALFQVFDAAYMVARSALRGTGDVRYPAVVCVILSWVSTPPLMWLLGYHYGLGALGGWIGLCVELCLGAAILWWRLERSSWRPAAARARAEREAVAA